MMASVYSHDQTFSLGCGAWVLVSETNKRTILPIIVSLSIFFWVILLIGVLYSASPVALAQDVRGGATQERQFYRIEVNDAEEAVLLEQQLKLKPELLRGRALYYYGDESLNRRLLELGYQPMKEDPDEIFTQVLRVRRKGSEAPLRELGALIILRESNYWVVRVNRKQARTLARLNYQVEAPGKDEPRPRLIRLTVRTRDEVSQLVAPLVDIDLVEPVQNGYLVLGGSFDYAIDDLRARGFRVEILVNKR